MTAARGPFRVVILFSAFASCVGTGSNPDEPVDDAGPLSTTNPDGSLITEQRDGGTASSSTSSSTTGSSASSGTATSSSSGASTGSTSSTSSTSSAATTSSTSTSSAGSTSSSGSASSTGTTSTSVTGSSSTSSGTTSSSSGGTTSSSASSSSSGGPRECSPEPCAPGEYCVGPSPEQAYCQTACAPGAVDAGCAPGNRCTSLFGVDGGFCEPAAGLGQECGELPCQDGLLCISENNTPARCFQRCTTTPDCTEGGTTCQPLNNPGLSYCTTLGGGGSSSSGGAGGRGDPCSPAPCQQGLFCVRQVADGGAFCEQGCAPTTPDSGCAGNEVCEPLLAVDAGFCAAGASLGESCAPPSCLQGLLCLSVDQNPPLCYEACALDGGTCTQQGATCLPTSSPGTGFCSAP
ncbi:MAG: hypothetical protein AB2A00_31675 [Myxococcota bacterium]